jgi:hypothetical protein
VLSNDIDPTDLEAKLPGWLQRKMPEARDLAISDAIVRARQADG